MKIYLHAWGNAWILHTLNPKTGRHSLEKIADPHEVDKPTNGHASMEPVFGFIPRFYGIYAFEGRLYFQAGRKKWDITDAEVETGYWCWLGLASGFRLSLNGKLVHRTTLLHPNRAVWPFIDPTYDGIDFDSDHFLFFLSEQLKREEWMRRLLSMESNPDCKGVKG
jgi:hypothetical protein